MKKDPRFRTRAPAPQADQDTAWDAVVRAMRARGDDDDLHDADDLPDDPEGHLVMGLKE